MSKSTLRVQEALLLPESISNKQQESDRIEFRNCSCRYSTEEENAKLALQGVDFELSKGQTLGVIGPVGCGKTTLVNTLIEETEIVDGTMKVMFKLMILLRLKSTKLFIRYLLQYPSLLRKHGFSVVQYRITF